MDSVAKTTAKGSVESFQNAHEKRAVTESEAVWMVWRRPHRSMAPSSRRWERLSPRDCAILDECDHDETFVLLCRGRYFANVFEGWMSAVY